MQTIAATPRATLSAPAPNNALRAQLSRALVAAFDSIPLAPRRSAAYWPIPQATAATIATLAAHIQSAPHAAPDEADILARAIARAVSRDAHGPIAQEDRIAQARYIMRSIPAYLLYTPSN